MTTVTLLKLNCRRCNHTWFKRREDDPRICPKCKDKRWNDKTRSPRVAGHNKTKGAIKDNVTGEERTRGFTPETSEVAGTSPGITTAEAEGSGPYAGNFADLDDL